VTAGEKRDRAVRRIFAAEGRTIEALKVIAAQGGESDQEVGLTYLGHLKTIRDRWPPLSKLVDTSNAIQAHAAADNLTDLAASAEGLATAAEERSKHLSRRPPTHGTGEPLPPTTSTAATSAAGAALQAGLVETIAAGPGGRPTRSTTWAPAIAAGAALGLLYFLGE